MKVLLNVMQQSFLLFNILFIYPVLMKELDQNRIIASAQVDFPG